MRIPNYLRLAPSGIWHFRQRIPSRQTRKTSKTEITRSLGTRDLLTAQQRALSLVQAYARTSTQVGGLGVSVAMDGLTGSWHFGHDEHVQSLKRTVAHHASEVIRLDVEANTLQAKQADVLSTIRGSLVKLHDMASPLLPEMIKALASDDRALVKEQLPLLVEATEPSDEASPTGLTPSPAFKSRAFG